MNKCCETILEYVVRVAERNGPVQGKFRDLVFQSAEAANYYRDQAQLRGSYVASYTRPYNPFVLLNC